MRAAAFTLLALAAAVAVTDAAVARKKLVANKDYEGKCYDPDTRLVLDPGAKKTDAGCVEYKCVRVADGFELLISGCSNIRSQSGCVTSEPVRSLPYPKCCPVLICSHP